MKKKKEIKIESGSTGYYGNADSQRVTKVHVIVDGKTICNTKISKGMRFQWCASFIVREYISCDKCKKILEEHYKKESLLLGIKFKLTEDNDKTNKLLVKNVVKLAKEHKFACKNSDCDISLHMLKMVLERAKLTSYLTNEERMMFI